MRHRGDFGHIWGPCKPPVRQRWAQRAQHKQFLSSSHKHGVKKTQISPREKKRGVVSKK